MVRTYFIRFLVAIFLGTCFVSCGDYDLFDSDKMADVLDWDADFVLPIGTGDIKLWDIFNPYDDESALIVENNRILIRYEEKDIFDLDYEDFWDDDNQETIFDTGVTFKDGNSGNLPVEVILSNSGEKEFVFDEKGEISYLKTNVVFTYRLPYEGYEYNVTFKIDNVIDSETGRVFEKTFTVNNYMSGSEDLVLEFKMEDDANKFFYGVEATIPAGQEVNVSAGDKLNVYFKLDQFEYQRIEGLITPPVIDVPDGNFDMNVSFWDDFEGDIYFAEPEIKISMRSVGIELPIQFFPDFLAVNGEERVDFVLTGEPEVKDLLEGNGMTYYSYIYDKNNSNAPDFVSLPPKDYIEYGGTIVSNEQRKTNCVITREANLAGDLQVEIPFNVKTDNMEFSDTIRDVKLDNSDQIKELALQLEAINETPLNIVVKELLMVDDDFNVIDRIDANKLVDAAKVDSNGNVTEATKGSYDIKLSESNIDNLNKMKHLILVAHMITEGTQPVELKPDANLRLTILAKAKLGIN